MANRKKLLASFVVVVLVFLMFGVLGYSTYRQLASLRMKPRDAGVSTVLSMNGKEFILTEETSGSRRSTSASEVRFASSNMPVPTTQPYSVQAGGSKRHEFAFPPEYFGLLNKSGWPSEENEMREVLENELRPRFYLLLNAGYEAKPIEEYCYKVNGVWIPAGMMHNGPLTAASISSMTRPFNLSLLNIVETVNSRGLATQPSVHDVSSTTQGSLNPTTNPSPLP